jgi:hypothetical protein
MDLRVISDCRECGRYPISMSDGIAGISAETDRRFVMILQRSIRALLTRKQVEAVFEQSDF